MSKRKVSIYTGNRAEYGLLNPVIKALTQSVDLELSLIISGAHLDDDYGKTIEEIEIMNISQVKRFKMTDHNDNKRIELLNGFSSTVKHGTDILLEINSDILLIAGDRFETFAMTICAFYLNIPVAHLFGGDLSQGGHLDDSVRHCVTKLAHLHFTTNEDSYQRVLKLGEEPWRVINSGSPVIDNVLEGKYSTSDELIAEFDLDLNQNIILFTQHPITTESEQAADQVRESLQALKELEYQTIITYPCNDPGGEEIVKVIKEFEDVPYFRVVKSLGWKRYMGLMKIASVVVGNSSSGIMETPIFKIPCVNIGLRQQGRLRSTNVIDVENQKDNIKEAIQKAIHDKEFKKVVKSLKNPYGEGGAAKKIAEIIATISLDKKLLQKQMTY